MRLEWMLALALAVLPVQAKVLRVCAGENEMPYSNREQQGFENAIAKELAVALGWPLEFVWWQDGRFVVRELERGRCDLIVGADPDDARLATSRPYYRSGWVFVARKGESFSLQRLKTAAKIAFPGNSPAEALVRAAGRYADWFLYLHELVDFKSRRNQYVRWEPKRLVEEVASGRADGALLWGPEAARYVKANPQLAMQLLPLGLTDHRGQPIKVRYAVALGVRKGEDALLAKLEQALARKQKAIERILRQEGVPLLP
nr:hypothetical conserved protein [uncultured Gammaproteobacteria bacterium]